MDHISKERLAEFLTPPVWRIIEEIGQIAADLHLPLYFIGGLVRDILLDEPSPDLDMVVEGPAIQLADAVEQRFGGSIVRHARFGTANWRPPAELNLPIDIDFVTARTETYAYPGALPDVRPATLAEDLSRRDFAINTLALRLDGSYIGHLIDHLGGMRDMRAGIIRVLHDQSFVDDPTRIWRAVRFEQRLSFSIESQTQWLLLHGSRYMSALSADRIRHELELIFAEPDPNRALFRLTELGVLATVHPKWVWTPQLATVLHRVDRLDSQLHMATPPLTHADTLRERRLLAAMAAADLAVADLSATLNLGAQRLQIIETVRHCLRAITAADWQNRQDVMPSEVADLLHTTNKRANLLLTLEALLPDSASREYVQAYRQRWSHVQISTTGRELRAAGIPPGPIYRTILDALLAAKLDGRVLTTADEEAFLTTWLAENTS